VSDPVHPDADLPGQDAAVSAMGTGRFADRQGSSPSLV
jgi:hypothetical protein